MKNPDKFFTEFSQHIFDVIAEICLDTESVNICYAKIDKDLEGKNINLQEAKKYLKRIIIVDSGNIDGITTKVLNRIYTESTVKTYPFVAEISHNVAVKFVFTIYPAKGQNKLYATISKAENSKDLITFKYRKSTLSFNPADIIYIGYGNHCVKVYTENGCTNMFNISFNDAADLVLEHHNFARSYKNCIINMDKVVKLENDSFIMINDDVIAIPKRRLNEIKNKYQEYINTK